MTIYKARILYDKGVIQKLAKHFSVSDHTVRNALRFVTEGEQPDAIRSAAIKYYGCVMTKKPIMPNSIAISQVESQYSNSKKSKRND